MHLFQDKSFFIKVASVGQEAGTGENWDDGLNHETHHIFITYTDSAINSIQTVYKQRGSSVISDRHGGDGTNFASIQVQNPLTFISGCYNYHGITSLTFGCENQTYGPFGGEKPNNSMFYFNFDEGARFGGFHGRSSSIRLMSLGVYVDTRVKHHLHPRINLHQLAAGGSCHSVRRWL
ncbi:hypothetical protein QJS04_geneDACA014512 [Acorus gramineus]|uniref:Jacalin-type lectin domain-containing protein n=1 Tax=Acorus gramineus TaxID=55184 RepID=A0AAV9ARF1_ACOGR|nr:hypothetical protein QJS04_geneDACA014512 [Acorus gramineus]